MVALYTKEQREFIKQHSKGMRTRDLADLVNKTFGTSFTVTQIANFKANHKCPSGLEGIGWFKAGHSSWNKGKKMSPEHYANFINSKNRFLKGNHPPQELPMGTERVNRDGMVEVKIVTSDYPENAFRKSSFNTGWVMKHHKVWIDYYKKPIPKGHKLVFIDQNKMNFDINNLKLVSNSLMARLNQNHRLGEFEDVNRAGIALEELKLKLREKAK